LKVVTLARNMDQLLGVLGSAGEISDADVIFNMVYYIVVSLKSESDPTLGAKLIEECSYIDNFMHEDQLGMIQQYSYVQHFKNTLGTFIRGEKACLALLDPKEDSDDDAGLDNCPVDFVIQQEKFV